MAADGMAGVGVMVNLQAVEHAVMRDPGGDVDAGADRALVQVGLAVRRAGGQAHHGHDRVTLEDDGADVGHALKGDVFEQRVEAHPVFDHGVVGLTAEAVHAAENVADVVFQ